MQRVHQFTTKFLGWLCIILFVGLVFSTTWQVFSRLVLSSPVTWSEELAKMLFVWLSFLGLAFVYGERGHMAVEFLVLRAPERTQKAFAIWTHVASLILGATALVWGGWNAAMNAWSQNLTALPVNIGSVYLVLPISGLAIVLYALYHIVEIAAGRESNFPIPEAEMALEDAEKIKIEAEAEGSPVDDAVGVADSEGAASAGAGTNGAGEAGAADANGADGVARDNTKGAQL
ncbi:MULTISPECIES: TRAP transporter small permease [Trueperella]|uniref:Sialic acid TRAP transporter permease protein SiaT n=1 Tax=Trueperella bernardiae TaxID=59561 RepID=A0A0W1KIT6_9ACTO|nr:MULTISPECIES: TRAP transporter small permease [Trueperella]KTF03543.1 Sialic acid TRAP transporter permease protein SiaT [Trueperella bernardiae]MDK8601911.1 TRAP transporter small permease [Trueperella bernardiae]MDV6239708.1 TRAP transporter small permease [Trueperella bernardiae]WIM07934.1 TRAP transporter small permease [Trueperella bernardiae]